jgi:hypothetical protein
VRYIEALCRRQAGGGGHEQVNAGLSSVTRKESA